MSCGIDESIYIFGGRSTVDHNDLIVLTSDFANSYSNRTVLN